ncbi:hypothetical protein SAMN06265365_11174 [Tistlia consotensis]|uniref:Uncharacterized protein n=1 Tax=Tistlia consotensis USBA 355 TaxID=560819 RepID=A0A1Y6BXQ0_9PROT|nr:hypothetical protein [Tistlia consotensis]SMF32839.1 hypothetical protein SAMN05428998_11175 [Tistlia consotensis USBA 355]SNR69047.1 hypothetical protein SAMN06265365_11174 [Tistlia consotensis]
MSPSGDLPGPAITVHWLEHAEAALRAAASAGRAVTLLSAPAAAFTVGPLYFREMVALARTAVPGAAALALFDCGAAPGRALEALHSGLEAIVFEGPEPQRGRLAAIAAAGGARLVKRRPPALDLLDLEKPEEAALGWLRDGTAPGAER